MFESDPTKQSASTAGSRRYLDAKLEKNDAWVPVRIQVGDFVSGTYPAHGEPAPFSGTVSMIARWPDGDYLYIHDDNRRMIATVSKKRGGSIQLDTHYVNSPRIVE